MIELQEGPIMLKDLSVWFGLRPETLAKSRPQAKEKKMKILSAFADWHYEGKKIMDVIILKTIRAHQAVVIMFG